MSAFILKAQTPSDAKDEKELREWLIKEIGEEDQRALVEWVWENHQGSGVAYVDALTVIVKEAAARGVKAFLGNLIVMAKKPKEIRQLETEIHFWWGRRMKEAVDKIHQHKNDPAVARDVFFELQEKLQEKLRSMFPNVHRALMKGAMITAFTHLDGTLSLNVPGLVKALRVDDPLSVNAKASWG